MAFKKLFTILIPVLILFSSFTAVFAQEEGISGENKIQINFFYSNICPHCATEEIFLEKLKNDYPQVEVNNWGVWEKENADLLEVFYNNYNVPRQNRGFVPATFIDERYFLGYETDKNSGAEIENYIREILSLEKTGDETDENARIINIPFFGEINVGGFSPLALAVVLGTLDGFNACAMVALGFLLAVLVSTKARQRVFLIGGVFIAVSGLVYFLFISAWFNLFLFLTNVKLITFLVALAVIFFAVYLLKDYFAGVVCKLCEIDPQKQSIFTKMEKKLFLWMQKILTREMSLPLTLLGVAVVAAGVNMVELSCSLGFPLIFTKILASWHLSTFSYYLYLLVYIIFYMIDDFIIFMIAVLTMRVTQASDKYLNLIKLVSGILLLILGALMLLNPEILVF